MARLLVFALVGTRGAAAEPTMRFPDPPAATPVAPSRQGPAPAPAPAAGVEKSKPPPREPWGRASAREHLRRALEHRRRGDAALALMELNEAIRFDPSYGEAYLELASVRESTGDLGEAERVYDTAARIPAVRARAQEGRARVLKSAGRVSEAFRDLESSVELEPTRQRLERLVEWYVERRAWPAALVASRRLLALLDGGPKPERDAARLKVQALVVLAGEVDPVVAGANVHGGWVRRSLATMARRPR